MTRWPNCWYLSDFARDFLLHQLEEIVGECDRLDDVLVGLVIPVAVDEIARPCAGERPAAWRGAVAVLLDDVEVALVLDLTRQLLWAIKNVCSLLRTWAKERPSLQRRMAMAMPHVGTSSPLAFVGRRLLRLMDWRLRRCINDPARLFSQGF